MPREKHESKEKEQKNARKCSKTGELFFTSENVKNKKKNNIFEKKINKK